MGCADACRKLISAANQPVLCAEGSLPAARSLLLREDFSRAAAVVEGELARLRAHVPPPADSLVVGNEQCRQSRALDRVVVDDVNRHARYAYASVKKDVRGMQGRRAEEAVIEKQQDMDRQREDPRGEMKKFEQRKAQEPPGGNRRIGSRKDWEARLNCPAPQGP